MGKPPRAPYPPDLDDDVEPPDDGDLLDLLDARLRDRDLANTRAVGSTLRRVELVLCRLTGAELAEAAWTDVSLEECRLDLAGLRASRLERVVFRDCRLDESDFAGARLRDVRFERCTLRGASLAGCTVERLELVGCDLAGLAGADALRGARMRLEDVLANAPLFAVTLGVEILGEGE